MPHVKPNRVQETSTSVGIGSLTLAGASNVRMRTFAAAMASGSTCWVLIEHATAAEWEISLATFSAGAITRSFATGSESSTGALIDFGVGTKTISVIAPSISVPCVHNGNTAVGLSALVANAGTGNTAVGATALMSNTTGTGNTAVGGIALYSNTAGNGNTAIGYATLFANTTGINNTALGYGAMSSNTVGVSNTAVGLSALGLNTTGYSNTAIGVSTLAVTTTGSENTAVGHFALGGNTVGSTNTAVGYFALSVNTTGVDNVAIGHRALDANTIGTQNTSVGTSSLGENTTGIRNVAVGTNALAASTTGGSNTAVGYQALASNTTSGNNVAVGAYALNYVQQQLIGPTDGADETVEGRLSLKYMLGRLFPRGKKAADLNLEEATEDGIVLPAGRKPRDGEVAGEDDPLNLALEELPSSVGLSFCVPPNCTLLVKAAGARYEPAGGKGNWRRVQIQEVEHRVQSSSGQGEPIPIFDRMASLRVIHRVAGDASNIVTVSLLNEQVAKSRKDIDEKTLFQISLRCSVEGGGIPPYPSPDPALLSEEDREALLLYSRGRPFAIGHGASASWEGTSEAATFVEVDFMPRQHVWRPVFDVTELAQDGPGSKVLSISFLADPATPRLEAIAELEALCAAYSTWIDGLGRAKVNPALADAAGNLIQRARSCRDRMVAGVRLLRNNDMLWECFQLANLAMLMQMCRAGHVRGERRKARESDAIWPPERDTIAVPRIDYLSQAEHRWRPFQIAFLLQVLRSLVDDVPAGEHNEAAQERDVADVLWFSTGGGKTEAYLLVAAFEMVRRRLALGMRGGGTAIISRYTYRFLTAEQFERTAGLICALELLRKEDPRGEGVAEVMDADVVQAGSQPDPLPKGL